MTVERNHPPDHQYQLGERVRAARARAGLTRKQLAAASGASERYLAHIENHTGNPSVEMLLAIAAALSIAPAELLPNAGEQHEQMASATSLLRRLNDQQLQEAIAFLQHPSGGRDARAKRIALVGLRGAGKSSLGAALAKRLGFPFFEISKEVERVYGGSIAILLEINGPSAVRRYESEVIESLCAQHEQAVIAAPGAIVADATVYEKLLSGNWTVWLQASPEDHMQRVMDQGDIRPMSGNRSAMDDLKKILDARSSEYARADSALDTSAQSFGDTLIKLELLCRPWIQ